MKKRGVLSSIFNRVVGQLPVIGPHADIEGELLLAGKKPLGWIAVLPPSADPDLCRQELDVQRRLGHAVAEGKLIAADVTQTFTSPKGEENSFIFRHYAQPGREKDLATMAAFNADIFNGKAPTVKLEKDFGDYLGYRRRDQLLWNLVQRYGHKAPKMVDAIYKLNANVTQHAYQSMALGDPSKIPLTMEQAAAAGDAAQQWRLGRFYTHGGQGYTPDPVKAAEWFKKSADQGYRYAQTDLANCYRNGTGVEKNEERANYYSRLAQAPRDPKLGAPVWFP